MKHAIVLLEKELLETEEREPRLRTDGHTPQANTCAAKITEFREAIGVLQRHEDRIGHNAGLLYDTYCKAVGGVAFNGDPLPDWDTFRADPGKRKQVEAWLAVGRTAAGDGGIVVNPASELSGPSQELLDFCRDNQVRVSKMTFEERAEALKRARAAVQPEPEQLHAPGDPEEGQPRTIRQWLETLPDGYRERALANMLKDRSGTSKRSNLSDALAGAFTWVESPEGHDFWSTIRCGEGFPPLPEA